MVQLEEDLHTTEEFDKVLTKVATNLFIYRSAIEEQEKSLNSLLSASEVEENQFKKTLHRLKGSYSLFSMHGLEKMTHQIEDLKDCTLLTWKSAFKVLNEETKNIHSRLASSLSLPLIGSHIWVNQEKIKSLAGKIGQPYRDELLALTNMKLSDYIASYSTFADELCSQLKKKIHGFTVNGPELAAFPTIIRTLQPILTLYVRNVVDHGFWTEDHKKNIVHVDFMRTGNRLNITISDSGRGMRPQSEITPNLISGRGLGMQIIKEQLKELNGFLEQNFNDEGCVLSIEMDWPLEEN